MMEATLPKVVVYRVGTYDITTDEFRLSRRLMTAEGAELAKVTIISDTAVEIDASDLEPGEQWTARDFSPSARRGFQTYVRS